MSVLHTRLLFNYDGALGRSLYAISGDLSKKAGKIWSYRIVYYH